MEIWGLGDDLISRILLCLESGEDIARASAVCRSWRRWVIQDRVSKRCCIMRFPELEVFQDASSSCLGQGEQGNYEHLKMEHRIYCSLYQWLTKRGERRRCIKQAIRASSTDHSPGEDISQTLYPHSERFSIRLPSYWSSKGQKQEDVPETLTYRLIAPLCVVDEIKVRPFEAGFQNGSPIYSSKLVRFKFGYEAAGEYVWNYVSPLYPMEQADTLQSFPLPRPVVCIGGIFQVELVGRVQKQETDQLYYICICHVSLLGKPLPVHDFEMKGGKAFVLKLLNEPHPELSKEAQVEDEEEEGDDMSDALRRVGLEMFGNFIVGDDMAEFHIL